jgi:hypothetical protein
MLGRRRSCLPGRILGLLLAQWQGTKGRRMPSRRRRRVSTERHAVRTDHWDVKRHRVRDSRRPR